MRQIRFCISQPAQKFPLDPDDLVSKNIKAFAWRIHPTAIDDLWDGDNSFDMDIDTPASLLCHDEISLLPSSTGATTNNARIID